MGVVPQLTEQMQLEAVARVFDTVVAAEQLDMAIPWRGHMRNQRTQAWIASQYLLISRENIC